MIVYERTSDTETLLAACNFTSEERILPLSEEWASAELLLDSYEQPPEIASHSLHLKPFEGCALLKG